MPAVDALAFAQMTVPHDTRVPRRDRFRPAFPRQSDEPCRRIHEIEIMTDQRNQKFRRVALVADRGRGHGTVKVFWNKKLLKKVSLAAKRDRKRKVIPVKTFTGKVRQGTLRVVVVSSGKVVRIDGLGIASR